MKNKTLKVNNIDLCRFSETINVYNNKFVFEIYREGETIFLIDGKPISVVWHDNGPSSVHFYCLNGINIDKKIRKQLEEFEDTLQDKIPEDFNLLTLFEIYKPLLKSGTYRVFYSPAHTFEVTNHGYSTRQLKPFELHLSENRNDSRPSLYLDEGVFMFTQSMETIDTERVKYYQEQILKGKQPTIITIGMQPKEESADDVYSQFKESYPQYIIDGHHKALAYQNINEENNKNGLPFEILVPGIFHIIRIPNKEVDKELSDRNRKELLSKLLTKKEVDEVVEFYKNWYR